MACFERIKAAILRGMDRSRAVFMHLDFPAPVREHFNHKNPFHPRARAIKALALQLMPRFEAPDAGTESDEEALMDEPEGLAQLRGPAVRRAHKALALAMLRAKLLERARIPAIGSGSVAIADLQAVWPSLDNVLVVGVTAWELICDVFEHSTPLRTWTLYGVWRFRDQGTLLASARCNGVDWEGDAEAPNAAQRAPVEAVPSAALVAFLSRHQMAELALPLARHLGCTNPEQLLLVREDDLRRLPDAGVHLSDEAKEVLRSLRGDMLQELQCSGCSRTAALARFSPCNHSARLCAACAPAAPGGGICVECRQPSTLVLPPTDECLFCADLFTAPEIFRFPCGHPGHFLCIADAVGCIRDAIGDRHSGRLPLRCQMCRVENPAIQPLPLAPASLRPLIRRSRHLLYNPIALPLTVAEFQRFEEWHHEAEGTALRCPLCNLIVRVGPPPPPAAAAATAQRIDCPECRQPFCRNHRTVWHEGRSCAEEDAAHAGEDAATRAAINATSKPCPNCAVAVTHYRGHACHHIMPGGGCPGVLLGGVRCGAHWCYSCRGGWPCQREACTPYCRDGGCDCPTCPDCRPEQPCWACDGHCPACNPPPVRRRR